MTIIRKDVQVGLDLIDDLTTQTLTEHWFKIILKPNKNKPGNHNSQPSNNVCMWTGITTGIENKRDNYTKRIESTERGNASSRRQNNSFKQESTEWSKSLHTRK